MLTDWRTAAEAFNQTLQSYSVRPDAVTDVETAWRAFAAFAQTQIGAGPHRDPLARALWAATPVGSELTVDPAD